MHQKVSFYETIKEILSLLIRNLSDLELTE